MGCIRACQTEMEIQTNNVTIVDQWSHLRTASDAEDFVESPEDLPNVAQGLSDLVQTCLILVLGGDDDSSDDDMYDYDNYITFKSKYYN